MTPQSESEIESAGERENDDESELSDSDLDLGNEECGSSDGDMESGIFFTQIERDKTRANHERKYLVEKLKAKSRVGSIFIDKIKRVVAAIQRESSVFDYLIEWEFSRKDKLKPTTSIVKGAHFVFVKPLFFRRYVEQNHIL
jgi:hypothetical protein